MDAKKTTYSGEKFSPSGFLIHSCSWIKLSVSDDSLINVGITSFSAVRFHGTDVMCVQDIIHLQLHCAIVIDFDDSAWSFVRCGATLRSPFVLCEDILV